MQQPIYHFDAFRLNPATRELWHRDQRVVVPARVFACLEYLIEHRDRAVGREELIRAIWHRDNVTDIRLGQLVLQARRAVDDEGNAQRSIRTVVGFGYHWIARTSVTEEPSGDDGRAPAPLAEADMRPTGAAAPEQHAAADTRTPLAVDHEPPRSKPRRRRRNALVIAVLLAAIVASALIVLLRTPRNESARTDETSASSQRLIVRPIELHGSADMAWARLGGMDLVADRLRRNGLAVVPSETALGILGAARDVPVDIGRVRKLSGASIVIGGALSGEGTNWRAELDANLPGDMHWRATSTSNEPMSALRSATDLLLVRLGRAPAADASTPEIADLIQRARAALLADDPAQARAILESVSDSAVRDAPEVRLALAQTDARAGRFDIAEREFSDLLVRIDAADDPRLRMRALHARAIARLRIGRLEDARADFDAALATASAETYQPEFADALNGRGIVAITLHDYETAISFLGRARLQFDRNGDALGVARVDTNLGLLQYDRGAFAEAARRFEDSIRVFADFGAVRELSSALSALMVLQSAELRNDAALATSDRFWPAIERAGDPAQRRGILLRRANALAAVGRLRESKALIDTLAHDSGPNLAETRDAERLQLLRTELALREGRMADAAREAIPLPIDPPPSGDDDLRAWSALVRQRAVPAPAQTASESTHAELDRERERIAAAPRTDASPLRALAVAERAARLGQSAATDAAFRLALSQAEAGGVPRTIATVIALYVPWLIENGRPGDAAAQVGRVSIWAAQDFDCALLQLRLARAQGQTDFARDALANARRLAGERPLPPDLIEQPLSEGPPTH